MYQCFEEIAASIFREYECSMKYLHITTTIMFWKRVIFEFDNFLDLRMLWWLFVSTVVFGDVST
jgi:hypothetical protein